MRGGSTRGFTESELSPSKIRRRRGSRSGSHGGGPGTPTFSPHVLRQISDDLWEGAVSPKSSPSSAGRGGSDEWDGRDGRGGRGGVRGQKLGPLAISSKARRSPQSGAGRKSLDLPVGVGGAVGHGGAMGMRAAPSHHVGDSKESDGSLNWIT
jgi:hypothetical protein